MAIRKWTPKEDKRLILAPDVGRGHGSRDRWTLEDDEKLRTLFSSLTYAEIAAEMGRTVPAVRARATHALHLTRKRGSRVVWTESEDEALRKLYGTMPVAKIAARLGRTCPAILARVHKNLGRGAGRKRVSIKRWTSSDDEQLRALVRSGIVSRAKVAMKLGRTLESVKSRIRTMGLCRVLAKPQVGDERVSKRANLLLRRVSTDTSIPWDHRWRPVHVLVWEAANGPIPEGHHVCFRPGMKVFEASQVTIDRLELLTPAEKIRRYSVNKLPRELRHVMRLRVAVNRRIKQIQKANKQ